MRVSVVIPCWNEQAVISRAVHSAWQPGTLEVIVVDGGSDDGTWELLQQLPCRAVRSPRGRAEQQNRGAELARGEVLLFLHADCCLAPGCVARASRALARFDRAVGGAFRQRIACAGLAFRLVELGNSIRALWAQLPFGDQAFFVRRSVFERLGGFPQVPIMEDVLLARAAAAYGHWLLLSGPVLVSPRRWLRCGVWRQTLHNWRLLWGLRRGKPLGQLAATYHAFR